MSFENGPYIQAACLCETVIREDTGVLTLVRIIDTITQSAAGPNPPKDMPPFTGSFKLVIMIKSGEGRGRFDLKIVPELPTGEAKPPVGLSVHLEGEEKGQNVILDFAFTFEHEGLHWLDIYLGDEKFTAIPVRVRYSRQITLAPVL